MLTCRASCTCAVVTNAENVERHGSSVSLLMLPLEIQVHHFLDEDFDPFWILHERLDGAVIIPGGIGGSLSAMFNHHYCMCPAYSLRALAIEIMNLLLRLDEHEEIEAVTVTRRDTGTMCEIEAHRSL